MNLNIYFAADPQAWQDYEPVLPPALARYNINATWHLQADRPELMDYIIYQPGSILQDFTPFTRAKAVLSLWAGVEKIAGNTSLTQPLCRMVDPALTEGMVEYVTGHCLRHHLNMDRDILSSSGWHHQAPPLARERTIAILGLGMLGQACAHVLTALNFNIIGWSRNKKTDLPFPCHHAIDGLKQVLEQADIVVTLLPLTPETENILNDRSLGWIKPGAYLINPGRGALIDDAALLRAIETGIIAHATLDVFRTEPLPDTHPFRTRKQITITPHIAAATRASTAAQVIAENIHRSETGLPLLYLVNRRHGY